ncbi:hypothetical protein RHMOL_Rhmol07G0033400 [Rhododendron molle]|uniref:Uncharacterized protein n=1 Tax=Rhododendron molle TaxID=49168 RepID=A0ACC0MWT0_RHOML|nr:hypothetical protein RHMOL_Rhmol07G0033400 [Rhododendron molle]
MVIYSVTLYNVIYSSFGSLHISFCFGCHFVLRIYMVIYPILHLVSCHHIVIFLL